MESSPQNYTSGHLCQKKKKNQVTWGLPIHNWWKKTAGQIEIIKLLLHALSSQESLNKWFYKKPLVCRGFSAAGNKQRHLCTRGQTSGLLLNIPGPRSSCRAERAASPGLRNQEVTDTARSDAFPVSDAREWSGQKHAAGYSQWTFCLFGVCRTPSPPPTPNDTAHTCVPG